MNVSGLIDDFRSSLSPEENEVMEVFISKMKKNKYSKGEQLHRAGKVCNVLHYITKGIIRTYYYKDEKDISVYFTQEGEMVTAIDSFIQQKPSKYNIETLEDTTTYSITFDELESMYEDHPSFERFTRIIMMQAYIDLVERAESIQLHSAMERYQLLTERDPLLLERVNLKHIATFLGISPETLSRVRSNGST